MNKNNSPFSSMRPSGAMVSCEKTGRGKEVMKRFGRTTEDQEEIDICLNCPYPDCIGTCEEIRKHRMEAKNGSKRRR